MGGSCWVEVGRLTPRLSNSSTHSRNRFISCFWCSIILFSSFCFSSIKWLPNYEPMSKSRVEKYKKNSYILTSLPWWTCNACTIASVVVVAFFLLIPKAVSKSWICDRQIFIILSIINKRIFNSFLKSFTSLIKVTFSCIIRILSTLCTSESLLNLCFSEWTVFSKWSRCLAYSFWMSWSTLAASDTSSCTCLT